MLSYKTNNKSVIEMYKGKTFIETNIKLFTEINDDLKKKLFGRIDLIEDIMKAINIKIEEIVMNNLEDNTDIAEIVSSIRGKLLWVYGII